MAVNFVQNNFASGELSPNLWGRTDRPFYKNGLEICVNFIPFLTGGLFFRRGFGYSVHTKLNRNAWGMPFRFNIDQAYTLEFTDYKLRIHKNGGVILETAKTVSGVVVATGVVTTTSHGFSNGDEVYFSGVVGTTELNGQFFLVANASTHTFTLTDIDGTAIDTTGFTAYVSGGTAARVYEIATPYLATECPQVKFCGTADLMYLYHPDHEPRVLIRSGNTSWAINTYTRYSSTKVITGITAASPGVITSAAHGFVTGDRIYLSHILGMVELNAQEFLVEYIGADSFSLKTLAGAAVDTSTYTTYGSKGDIALVRDVGLAITGVSKAAAGIVTIAGHGFATYDKIYISGIVGMTELNDSFYWVKKIDANTFSLTTELGVDVDTTGYTTWSSAGTAQYIHGLFTKIGDFPGACGLYGGRFVAGGTDNDTDVFWMSKGPDSDSGASQYDDFTIGTADTDGMVFTLTSQNSTADRIYWFSGTPNFMTIGTSGGVYKANGGVDGSVITPTAIYVTPVSSVGAADMMPLFINNQTYYLEQGSLTIRGFGYSLIEDTYKAYDKNILAEEISTGGITQIVYAKGRPELIYAVRSDGVLLSCTILESDDVAGWARHFIGGSGRVLSVVVEPKSSGFDRVGIFVERTIDGHTRRYVEYLTTDPQIPDIADYFTGEDNYAADLSKFEKIVFELQKQINRLDSSVVLDTTQTIVLTLGAVSGASVTATAASTLFVAGDVGRYIYAKFLTGTETGIAKIIGFTSGTVVTVEILETFSSVTQPTLGWYLTTTSVSGVGHLEGETLGVLTDGGVHSDEVVSAGVVTLDYPVRYVILGKRYTGIGRTLDLDTPVVGGVSSGRLRNIEQLFIKLRNTLGGKYGATLKGLYSLTELDYRRAGVSYYDRPPLLYSGIKQVPLRDTWANEKKLYFVQDQPLPMTLLAIVPSEDIGEEE